MATKLLYLEDFDVVTASAVVTKVYAGEEGQSVVELDQTCFYPRGGGQDWDTGVISAENGAKFVVEMVRLDENGVVQQYGQFENGSFAEGESVKCTVDEVRRQANTRLHSAGHLIDMAVDQLGYPWVPAKGAHYPHMSFVEYDTGDFVADDATRQAIQTTVDELSARDYQNQIMFLPVSEMGRYCRHVPGNIPTNKPARIVLYADDFGIPCGGTHVRSVREIGKIEITKVKSKQGVTKVSYRVEGIN
ncbi:MAG TPA: alanine--tRNA ligase-related protein [Candidatus Saccharimonadales bacterium]|nr:alanine--tRNA ligase-related protein [Candidatus Saccharimonadales bacterium]